MSDTFDFPTPGQNQGEHLPADMAQASAHASAGSPDPSPAGETAVCGTPRAERRTRRRALISAPVRVRTVDLTGSGPDEISTTLDVSRSGFLFVSSLPVFTVGMEVAVTFPYSKSELVAPAEQPGRVARVKQMEDGRFAVAIALGTTAKGDLVDSNGNKLDHAPAQAQSRDIGTAAPDATKPLVLAVDADPAVRQMLKTYLVNEGYEVIAVSTANEAHEVLKMFTPALLISEIEGEELPGYDLCAHVKSTPRLQTVPVVLTTSSAYPSDYANAHSLGAVVCMAKPFRCERLGHVVRLLAPTKQAKEQTAPARPADPKRKCPSPNPSNRNKGPRWSR
ncbi:MAG TPA: response regulator [Candidatus Acidoferrales bacterium]|nr:response regulator [Candidatus Acidoferrales bacterium]